MHRIPLVALTLLFTATTGASAADPVAKCTAAKVKAAGKKYASKAKCHATAIAKGVIVSSDCLAKAESKFETAVAKADAKGDCVGDAATIESNVDSCISTLIDDVTPSVGDACTDASDCGDMVCATSGFPDGYCTVEGCPTAGSTGGCPTDSVCTDPPFGPNYCAARCDTADIGTQGTCRSGYLCIDVDPSGATTGGCIPE